MTVLQAGPLTEQQSELIDRLSAGLRAGIYMEKRATDPEFCLAVLLPDGPGLDPMRVMVSDLPKSSGGYVVVTTTPFSEIKRADVILEPEDGARVQLSGRVEASRPGRRVEDQQRAEPLHFSVFHPNRSWTNHSADD